MSIFVETLNQELGILKRNFLVYLAIFSCTFLMLMVGTFQPQRLFGHTLYLVVPGTPSIATQIFLRLREVLVPPEVVIVTLGPVSPFLAPIIIALLVSFLLTFPIALFQVLRYIQTALYPHERATLWFSFFPALLLFYGGAWFSLTVLIPQTFAVLYAFAAPLGVAPYFNLADFLSSVFLLVLLAGGIFLLPLYMYILTKVRIIPAKFWLEHWRGAVLTTLIFSAIATPDGSGITMVLLSLPLMTLYGLGVLVAKFSEQQ